MSHHRRFRRRPLALGAALAAALLLAGCGDAPAGELTADGAARVVRDLTIAPRAEADRYEPADGEPTAGAVLAHGAGTDRASLGALATRLAGEGLAVLNVDWHDRGDVACGVRTLRAEHDGIPVVVVGHSAGAANGAMVAVLGDELTVDDCEASTGSVRPDAFVGVGGPYDVARPHDHAEAARGVRFRLLAGAQDTTVDPSASQRFADALEEAGVDVELTILEDSDHCVPACADGEAFEQVVDAVLAAATT